LACGSIDVRYLNSLGAIHKLYSIASICIHYVDENEMQVQRRSQSGPGTLGAGKAQRVQQDIGRLGN